MKSSQEFGFAIDAFGTEMQFEIRCIFRDYKGECKFTSSYFRPGYIIFHAIGTKGQCELQFAAWLMDFAKNGGLP